MKQEKNTINGGDAIKDLVRTIQDSANKQRVLKAGSLWHGSVEADKLIQPHDIVIKQGSKTQKMLGLPYKVYGRIAFGFRGFNIREIKHENFKSENKIDSFQLNQVASGLDWLIHIRPAQDHGYNMIIVHRDKIISYFTKQVKINKRGATVQLQKNTFAPMPIENSAAWKKLESAGIILPADHLAGVAADLLLQINEAGRLESQADSSNAKNNSRRVGNPYKER